MLNPRMTKAARIASIYGPTIHEVNSSAAGMTAKNFFTSSTQCAMIAFMAGGAISSIIILQFSLENLFVVSAENHIFVRCQNVVNFCSFTLYLRSCVKSILQIKYVGRLPSIFRTT